MAGHRDQPAAPHPALQMPGAARSGPRGASARRCGLRSAWASGGVRCSSWCSRSTAGRCRPVYPRPSWWLTCSRKRTGAAPRRPEVRPCPRPSLAAPQCPAHSSHGHCSGAAGACPGEAGSGVQACCGRGGRGTPPAAPSGWGFTSPGASGLFSPPTAPVHMSPELPTPRREVQSEGAREPGEGGTHSGAGPAPPDPGGALLAWPQPSSSSISPVHKVEVRGVVGDVCPGKGVEPRPRGCCWVLEPPGARDAEEQLQRLREERVCKVCLDRTVCTVFVPCGHLVCAECAPALQLCPVCRAPIRSCVRTFLP